MWLDLLEERLLAAIRRVRLMREAIREFVEKLALAWSADPWPDRPPPEDAAPPRFAGSPVAAPHRPAVVRSPRRSYSLRAKLAAGDLCDVYLADSEEGPFALKLPRVQDGAADARLSREFAILRRLVEADAANHYRLYFPQPVESFALARQGPRCNVLAWEEGLYTAGEIATRHPAGVDGRHLAWMFKRTLAALGYVHRHGWVHGAVLPPHLLFHAENHGLRLAGWTHAVRIGEPLTAVPADFASWYPPESRRAAAPATDIYLAAKSMLHLAGGDAWRGVWPQHVPQPMRLFFESCLLASPRMRPADAWRLHDEFDDLLADLYGPPQYVKLEMT